ncbi:synaptojanin, putative [Entamoeba invadens IP1]|uniref:Synaptojanin, putative n=1 Tax=Entamoeba invadens IP1 TaxID=370355 RepID=A0A0A1UC56_ENTIV|nr:synaptojanin, putative [Entamoeba invadens IP1]ELP92713.1 synaptojanin, putative [Entamoeba invadens IP1]|eukprot:XP_004259484.1 synaptojanin, putative [Entamoeba invadens IP1]
MSVTPHPSPDISKQEKSVDKPLFFSKECRTNNRPATIIGADRRRIFSSPKLPEEDNEKQISPREHESSLSPSETTPRKMQWGGSKRKNRATVQLEPQPETRRILLGSRSALHDIDDVGRRSFLKQRKVEDVEIESPSPVTTPQRELDFTIETQNTFFNPIAPKRWIESEHEPSREYIASNMVLYNDITSYFTDKEMWLKTNMLNNLPYYATAKRIKVLMCTWNVNQCVFNIDEVNKWTQGVDDEPDIIVCGLQELEMKIDAIITGKKYSEKSIMWENLILASINRGPKMYKKLGYYQLCGVVQYVFFNTEMEGKITEVGYEDTRVGAMSGKLANKGGVAYRMKIYDSTVCFVVSHLAAHQHFWEKRNQDWNEIAKMRITYYSDIKKEKMKVNLLDHDIVFWEGDLNYRVEMTDFDVRKNLKAKKMNKLIKHDQLLQSIQRKEVFSNFSEAPITFDPTFKIVIGSGEYVDNRIPSWCDRILWKTENRHHVEVVKYTSHELYQSDHKPVSCVLNADLQEVDKDKKRIVETYLKRVAEKYERIKVPKVIVEPNILTVEGVELFKSYTVKTTIRNVGKFTVKYSVKDSVDGVYQNDWLSIQSCDGVIDIFEGKDVVVVTVQIYIQLQYAWMYQDRNMLLKKVVFQFGDDKSLEVPMTVIVKTPPCIFGMRLESLNRLPRPIVGQPNKSVLYNKLPFWVPKEIYRLTDYIIKNYQMNCFVETMPKVYSEDQLRNLVYALNTESNFDKGPIQLFCDGLLTFLSALHHPLSFYDMTDNNNLTEADIFKTIRFVIPDEYRHLFCYIVSFIKKLKILGEEPDTLVTRFAPHMFRCYKGVKIAPFIKFLKNIFNTEI